MQALRKVLIVVLIALLVLLGAFFVVLLGAPHFQGDDVIIVLSIGAIALFCLFMVSQWKPEE